jgi:hypothetical protein
MSRSADLIAGHAWKLFAAGLAGMVPVLVLQFAGGMLSALAPSWILAAVVDCVTDVTYRFNAVLLLVVYLGLARGDGARLDPAVR